jgi:hypothetical protein
LQKASFEIAVIKVRSRSERRAMHKVYIGRQGTYDYPNTASSNSLKTLSPAGGPGVAFIERMKSFQPQIYLGFLAVSAFGQSIHSEEKVRAENVIWLVNYDSESPSLAEAAAIFEYPGIEYEAVKAAWLMQVNGADADAKTLANAARFFAALEPVASIELLTRARAIEPCNSEWTDQLAEVYATQIESGQFEPLMQLLDTNDRQLLEAVAIELHQRAAVAEYVGLSVYRR